MCLERTEIRIGQSGLGAKYSGAADHHDRQQVHQQADKLDEDSNRTLSLMFHVPMQAAPTGM